MTVTIEPEKDEYAKVNFNNKNGVTLARVVAHEWTNPKVVDGKLTQYLHNHFSIYLSIIKNGIRRLKGVVDLIHSTEKPQIQLEDIDLIFKSNSIPIIRDSLTHKFYAIKVIGGKLILELVDDSYIHWATKTKKIIDKE